MSESDHLQEFKEIMDSAHVDYTKSEEPKKSMTEPKFTPGPWTAVQHGDGIYTWTILGNDEMEDRSLAIVGVGTPNLKRDEANMHLIAAAPEMYEALKSSCTICQLLDHETDCENCRYGKVLRKARGESEVSE